MVPAADVARTSSTGATFAGIVRVVFVFIEGKGKGWKDKVFRIQTVGQRGCGVKRYC